MDQFTKLPVFTVVNFQIMILITIHGLIDFNADWNAIDISLTDL